LSAIQPQEWAVRIGILLAPLAAAAALVACSNGQNALPTATTPSTGVQLTGMQSTASAPTIPQPPPANKPVGNWSLTTVITSVTGPRNCLSARFRSQRGTPIAWSLSVVRSASSVAFDYDVNNWPTDDVLETGTVDGDAFTAQSAPWQVFFPACSDGTTLAGLFVGTVTGRFSSDGTHLTGSEVWSYQLTSGEIDVTMEWTAVIRG